MENKIQIVNSENRKMNHSTGLMVTPNEEYLAESGFKYISGVRQLGDLNIVEDVANGNAVNYLNGVRVFNKEKVLIIDKRIEKGVFYERERARQIVRDELLKMLSDANKNNPYFDTIKALEAIDQHLKTGYYSQSYDAINDWYNNLLDLNM